MQPLPRLNHRVFQIKFNCNCPAGLRDIHGILTDVQRPESRPISSRCAEIHLVTYSLVSVGPGRKPWKPFCRDEPQITEIQLVTYRSYIDIKERLTQCVPCYVKNSIRSI